MSGIAGTGIVSCLPTNIQPTLSLVGYHGDDSYYLWQDVVDEAINAFPHTSLDFYRSYNSKYFKPHTFFDSWQRLLELLPESVVVRCSQMSPTGVASQLTARDTAHYTQVTGDADTACRHGDSVWFSPSCRANTTECVPLMIRHSFEAAMQLAFFLDLPLAIVMVSHGAGTFAEYYAAAQTGRFLFHMWMPDDTLVDAAGRLPVPLQLPLADPLGQSRGVYRTGFTSYDVRNYVWRGLEAADPRVHYLATSFALYDADMAAMMNHSHALQAAGEAPAAAARRVACEWVTASPDRWRPWIPPLCPPGLQADASVAACAPCLAGSSCPGGFAATAPCPRGSFCPAGASVPTPCPAGLGTPGGGATAAANCTECADGGAARIGGACVPQATLVPSILLPLAALLAAAAAAYHLRRLGEEEALWRIHGSDLTCPDPPEVLGRGAYGLVVRAQCRGTPVALKHFSGGAGGAAAGAAGAAGGGGSTGGRPDSWETLPAKNMEVPAPARCASWEKSAGGGSPARPSARVTSNPPLWNLYSHGAGGPGTPGDLRRGMKALTGIRHPCITAVMGVCAQPPGLLAGPCLVMELMEMGSLWDLVRPPCQC